MKSKEIDWQGSFQLVPLQVDKLERTLENSLYHFIHTFFQLLSLTIILFLLLTTVSYSPEASTNWISTYGKGGSNAYSVIQTTDGGMLALGGYSGSGSGVWALKLDSTGVVEWQNFYRGIYGYDNGEVIQTEDGNYIAVAYNELEPTAFLFKLDQNGELLWTKRSDEYTDEGDRIGINAKSIEQADDNGFIIAGTIEWREHPGADRDCLVIKVDSTGSFEWAKAYGLRSADRSTQYDEAHSITKMEDGSYFVTGESQSFDDNMVSWILRLDQNGSAQWQKYYTGTNGANSVLEMSDGSYLVGGHVGTTSIWEINNSGNVEWAKDYGGQYDTFRSSIYKSGNQYVIAGAKSDTNIDAWLLGLNSQGGIEWEKLYGKDEKEWFNSIKPSTSGGIIAAGFTDEFGGPSERAFLIAQLDNEGCVDGACDFVNSEGTTAEEITVVSHSTEVTPLEVGLKFGSTEVSIEETQVSQNVICYSDTTPPNPNPMTWETEPNSTGTNEITMQASSATDPEGNGVEYYFEETTGNSGGSNSNWQDSNTYTDTGLESGTEYCYRVKARDKSDNQNETDWSTTKCATTDNQLPEAAFTYTPDNPVTDESITLDASNSSDPDGSIDTYKWDWTDDGSYESTTSSVTTTHSYEDSGTYTVKLEVVDDDGATDTATKEVTVQNQAPTAEFSYTPQNPSTDDTIEFTDESSDPDGNVDSWDWSLGDGTTSSDQNPSHSYSDDGSYTVELTVTDGDGATDFTSTTVTVTNVAPIAEDDTVETDEDNSVEIDVLANDEDPDGSLQPDTVTVTTGPDHGTTSVDASTGNVTYTPDENYHGDDSFTYTVDDDDGATSNEATVSITVKDVNDPPTASFEYSPSDPITEETIDFDASSSADPDDPDGSIDTYKWDWTDDGSYESTTSSATTTHSYEDGGTYTVKLEVVDDDGATDNATKEVHVRNNTQKGKNVGVGFEKSKYFCGKMRGVKLTYEEVTATGSTGVIKQPEPKFDQPQGITFLGGFYKIETTASHKGSIAVEIYYDDTDLTSQQEDNLKLFKLSSEGEYKDITKSVDKQEDVITGRTDSFSHFSLGYGTGTVPSTDIVNHGPNPMPAEGGIFWFDLPQDAESSLLKVYDVDGTPLLTVDINSTQKRYPTIGRWNLRTDGGDKLGNGIYIYRLKVNKDDGSTIWSTVHKLVIDRRK